MIDIRRATAEDVPELPAIEEAACALFDQIPATPRELRVAMRLELAR